MTDNKPAALRITLSFASHSHTNQISCYYDAKPWPNGNASSCVFTLRTDLRWLAKRTRKCTKVVKDLEAIARTAIQYLK